MTLSVDTQPIEYAAFITKRAIAGIIDVECGGLTASMSTEACHDVKDKYNIELDIFFTHVLFIEVAITRDYPEIEFKWGNKHDMSEILKTIGPLFSAPKELLLVMDIARDGMATIGNDIVHNYPVIYKIAVTEQTSSARSIHISSSIADND